MRLVAIAFSTTTIYLLALIRTSSGRRLVVRILRHQPSLERPLEYRLPQPLGPLQIGRDRGLHLLHHRQPPLDLGDDAVLFGEGRSG